MENQVEQPAAVVENEITETTVLPEPAAGQINEDKLASFLEQLRLEQNMPLAIVAGLAASLVGAIVWAIITSVTGYQIGYMAVAIGFLVGFAIRTFGKGIDKIYGIMGAAFSIFGCLVGNFLTFAGYVSKDQGIGIVDTLLLIDYSLVPEAMIETFSPMDVLFYGIAIYEGYKFSFRKLTEHEILANAGV